MSVYGELLDFDIKGLHSIPFYGFLRLYAESPRWPLIDGDGDANKQKFAPRRGCLASSVIGFVMCVLLMRTVELHPADRSSVEATKKKR